MLEQGWREHLRRRKAAHLNAETVKTLLEQQHDHTDPMRSGNGGGDTGWRIMPHAPGCRLKRYGVICTCHLRQYAELDRLMSHMRDDRQTPLFDVGDDRVSLRSLHWHVHHRYRRTEVTAKTVRYSQGRLVGVVERPGVATSKVTPMSSNQAIVGQAAGWETHLSEQRHKRSKNARDVRVLVASWHRDVRPVLVDLGVRWIANSWALERVAPELVEVAA